MGDNGLQARVIGLAETVLRAEGVACDRDGKFPRRSFEALAELELLGLLVPRALGGSGGSYGTAAMVVETIARHACPSTALCYALHLVATCLLVRSRENSLGQELMGRLDRDVLVGALSCSDPETGGRSERPVSSSATRVPDGWHVQKRTAWTTSAGAADWYVVQAACDGLTNFLVLGHEVTTGTGEWSSLGVRASRSGPLGVDAVFPQERLLGKVGDGEAATDDVIDPVFLLCAAACWNGTALGMLDIARGHVTARRHVDVDKRVCDYPGIQDYFGEAAASVAAARALNLQMAQALDTPGASPAAALPGLRQAKYLAAKTVSEVGDHMLHACGGSGLLPGLGLERYIRDGKAGWVMGPSNEVLRQQIGREALGLD